MKESSQRAETFLIRAHNTLSSGFESLIELCFTIGISLSAHEPSNGRVYNKESIYINLYQRAIIIHTK
jgi:hypothetical protein